MSAAAAKRQRDKAAALRRMALFRTLAPATLARLAANAAALNLPRGRQLCCSGMRCAGLYSVVSGRIVLSVGAPNDASKVIELIGPGGHVGLAGAMLDAPAIATAETLAESTVLLIPRAALADCATHHAELGVQLALALAREVRGLIADIEAFSLRSGRERVANYLLKNAAANAAQPRTVTLPAKKSIIASRLGLTPEYFSRMLHELIAAAAITVHGRQITVLDPGRLRNTSY